MTLRIVVLTFLMFGALALTVVVAEQPEAPILSQPSGSYRAGWVQLVGENGSVTPLWLSLRDGALTSIWLAGDSCCGLRGSASAYVNEIAASEKDGRLKGSVHLRRQKGRFGGERVELVLDLTIDDGRLAGNWQVKAEDQNSSGTATGELQSAEQMRETELLASGASWPTKLGPTWDGRASASGHALINDLRQARPVWRSEAYLPTGWGNGPDSRYKHRAQLVGVCGGASTPVVASGRVYCFYYEPRRALEPMDAKLPAYPGSHLKEPVSNNEILAPLRERHDFTASHPTEIDSLIRWHAVRADHVVVCLDAATGQTLWKSSWQGKTVNHQTHKWRGFNPTPTVAGDALYVCDYTSRMYAYDALTGKLRWAFEDFAREELRGASPWPMPVVFDNIVVMGGNKRVVGLDVKSGQVKWTAQGNATSGRPIVIDGKDRLLILGGEKSPTDGIKLEAGKIYPEGLEASSAMLLDPVSGRVLWTKTLAAGCSGPLPMVLGDRIISQQSLGFISRISGGNHFQRLSCWKLSDSNIEKLWDSEMMDSNDTIALAPVGEQLVTIDNNAIRYLDLKTGNTIKQFDEGETRGLLRTACSHLVAGDGKLVYQPEGHHGTQWLYLLPSTPEKLQLPDESEAWYPPHVDTTAYSQDPLVNPLVDGRLFLRGADGIYCYDLRTQKGE